KSDPIRYSWHKRHSAVLDSALIQQNGASPSGGNLIRMEYLSVLLSGSSVFRIPVCLSAAAEFESHRTNPAASDSPADLHPVSTCNHSRGLAGTDYRKSHSRTPAASVLCSRSALFSPVGNRSSAAAMAVPHRSPGRT